MKKLLQPVIKKWYWFLLGAAVLGEAAVFLFFGENSYIAVHDNLDLFMGHFMAMKHSGTFFAHDAVVPILGGITRDYLSSEFSLYNILFFLLPPFAAYLCGYFLKILTAVFSVYVLAKDIYDTNGRPSAGSLPAGQDAAAGQGAAVGQDAAAGQGAAAGQNAAGVQSAASGRENAWEKYRPIAVVCGLIYGLLPLFPTYGIAFSSIPLVIFLLRRIYRGEAPWSGRRPKPEHGGRTETAVRPQEGKTRGWLFSLLLLFFYPLLSYFSYFGIFILGYLLLAILILWVRDGLRGRKAEGGAAGSEEAGAAAIAVHGRTRDQMYMGRADWDIIRQVKQAVQVPVIGNGDVVDAQSACQLLDATGCDMVLVGRGAMGNPWVFRQINAYLRDSCTILPPPGIAERIVVIRRHMDALCALKGEQRAMREARKHVGWYLHGVRGAAQFRRRAGELSTLEDLDRLLGDVYAAAQQERDTMEKECLV